MDIFYWVYTHSINGIDENVVGGLNEDIISDYSRTINWLGSIKSIERIWIIGKIVREAKADSMTAHPHKNKRTENETKK